MRFILFALLLAACNSHEDIPVETTVVEGTYVSSTSFGNQSAPRLVILFLDKNGVARQESFDIGCSGAINSEGRSTETVTFDSPLYSGNHFKIVKTAQDESGRSSYTVSKLE